MSSTLYQELLSIGRKNICANQKCGEYKHQLKALHDFIYIVESTPRPEDPFYSPMFIDCIIEKSMWNPELEKFLEDEKLSYDLLNYNKLTNLSRHLLDTHKRRLLHEMLDKWWFFQETMAPEMALSDALQFRKNFFMTEFAYLPKKFRELVEKSDFNTAINQLTEEEHLFLEKFIEEMNEPVISCGCIPFKKSAFMQRFTDPSWHDLPELEIYETDGVDVRAVKDAVLDGNLLYLIIHNHYDCMDRNLYIKLYNIFNQQKKIAT